MTLILSTILLRPYVFLFFGLFFTAALRFFGWQRAVGLTAITWATAFLAEFSSTRNGIPFGYYVYLDETRDQELWISNLPFFDSFSFTFLAYASYMVALAFTLPAEKRGRMSRLFDDPRTRSSGTVLGLGTLLFTFSDIVIDPLAIRGDRWFLGKIFYYPEAGIYFGVPITNFVGWAVVGFVSLFLFQRLDRYLTRRLGTSPARDITPHVLAGIALYYIILAFNLALTFAIGERLLGMVGLLIFTPVTALLWVRFRGGYAILPGNPL